LPKYPDSGVNRIIDANINRAKEGLRVCEEITRFVLDNRAMTCELKNIRHEIDAAVKELPGSFQKRLEARRSSEDVGREIYANELKRKNLGDIFFANMQRAKESVRVLEEFTKLINTRSAVKFKRIRYEIYSIEKKVVGKI
jgi:thiamine-phosphate pyrophosphorylase